jgi:hypothetical protein
MELWVLRREWPDDREQLLLRELLVDHLPAAASADAMAARHRAASSVTATDRSGPRVIARNLPGAQGRIPAVSVRRRVRSRNGSSPRSARASFGPVPNP